MPTHKWNKKKIHTWNIVCIITVKGLLPENSVTLKTLRPHLFTSSSS